MAARLDEKRRALTKTGLDNCQRSVNYADTFGTFDP
jgi:hypothetical protein